MNITKLIIIILAGFIAWDIVTTYYGAVSIFVGDFSQDVPRVLAKADMSQHVTSILVAIMLIVLILLYKRIFIARNKITLGLLYVGFVLDFVTSLYGTASATGVLKGDANPMGWILVIFLSLGASSAPLLIHQVMDGEE